MSCKPSPVGKGGVHQQVWKFMRPETRRIFNEIYPDDRTSRRSQAYSITIDNQALLDAEASILSQFRIQLPHDICYRVIAIDGSHPNWTGLQARAQWMQPTIQSVRGHLSWVHFLSPWISLSSTWTSALRGAQYFTGECGASRVSIMVIDMEPIYAACIDAYHFALADHFAKPWQHRAEVICFNAIPDSCFLAEIPAQQRVPKLAPGLRLGVPEDLLVEAISTYSNRLSRPRGWSDDDLVRDCEAVSCWIFDSIWSKGIFAPQAKMYRIMQSFAHTSTF